MKLRLSLLLAAASACATVQPANTLPQPAAASSAPSPQFLVDPALVELAASCRGEELAQPNAIDDDCDGKVDGQQADGALVTLAYRKDATLRVVMHGPEGARELDASCEQASLCVARVHAAALPPGRYALRVENLAQSADALPTSVAVSKSGEGEVRTYLAALTQPGEIKALGTLVRE